MGHNGNYGLFFIVGLYSRVCIYMYICMYISSVFYSLQGALLKFQLTLGKCAGKSWVPREHENEIYAAQLQFGGSRGPSVVNRLTIGTPRVAA